MRTTFVMTVLGLALLGQTSHAQSRTAPFVLAILADNNALLPFASFDGDRWRKIWQEPVNGYPKLIAPERIPPAWWGGVPYQPTWEVVAANGRRGVRIIRSVPATLGSCCAVNVGMRIDAPRRTFEPNTALATSRPDIVEPVTALTPQTLQWKHLDALLPRLFRKHFGASVDRPSLLKMFMSSEPDGQYFYFEASRWPESVIVGWLRSDASSSSLVIVSLKTGDRDGDGKGMEAFQPLGIIRDGDRRFWIGFLNSYANSALAIIDVRRNWMTEHVRVDYGGC
jgi:hypothetical protein